MPADAPGCRRACSDRRRCAAASGRPERQPLPRRPRSSARRLELRASRNPDLDLAGWAASLHLEGGPPPHELLPGAGGLAAVLAGFFASRAGLPPPPTAPGVRAFQLAQGRVAIPWALRELGLRSDT